MSSNSHITIPMRGEPFAETLAFFIDELGMQMQRISPADDPRVAIIDGPGVTLRLDKASSAQPTIAIDSGHAPTLMAPNGVEVQFVDPVTDDFDMPDLAPELVITNAESGADWIVGRAGMRYRDLIPSRLGGRYIASHIEVCDGGPVPDLVHHHAIRFQMIFCHRGWVDVVYEDQGEPFRLHAGDCVLQPPHIRHRVLESSAGAQVVEIGCPAEHDTFFDYALELPTDAVRLERDFGGQRFVRHRGAQVDWLAHEHEGFEIQTTAIGEATGGLADVRVVRSAGATSTDPAQHSADFWFLFVLDGSTEFCAETRTSLVTGDSVAIPAGMPWHLEAASADLRLLEVVVQAPAGT